MSVRRGFTLIELLVVIAIIAILSVVVILTLNPAELLRQSRDANRLSDLDTINHAIALYSTDQSASPSFSLGAASTTYISIADPLATSTAGDQCQGLNLPTLSTSTGWTYHCASSSTLRSTNGTGWIPINFSNISSGSPFGNLPIDNTNQSSTNFYYTYQTDGTKYAITATLESQKYLKQYLLLSNPDPARYAVGTNLALVQQGEGLIGYWPLDEGSGSVAQDLSGNGMTGTWNGTASGTNSTYYGTAKVGTYSGVFNGNNNYISLGTPSLYQFTGPFSLSAWINTNATGMIFSMQNSAINGYNFGANYGVIRLCTYNGSIEYCAGGGAPYGAWYHVVGVYNGTNDLVYVNGVLVSSASVSAPTVSSGPLVIGLPQRGGYANFTGSIDDLRIYNRALSAGEIASMYNAEK